MTCLQCQQPLGLAWYVEHFRPTRTSANAPSTFEPPIRLGPYCAACSDGVLERLRHEADERCAARGLP